jgi:hypothetical protein
LSLKGVVLFVGLEALVIAIAGAFGFWLARDYPYPPNRKRLSVPKTAKKQKKPKKKAPPSVVDPKLKRK